jgi:hypothetical protein
MAPLISVIRIANLCKVIKSIVVVTQGEEMLKQSIICFKKIKSLKL